MRLTLRSHARPRAPGAAPRGPSDAAVGDVRKHLLSTVAGAYAAPARKRDCERLIALLDGPGFYDAVATLDAAHARDWRTMGQVQRRFHAAEPGFDDVTRAYSESMRITLHAAVVLHLLVDDDNDDLFDTFLRLHVTAFHDNGGWFDNLKVGVTGALEVLGAADPAVFEHLDRLLAGVRVHDEITQAASGWVRAARTSAGLRPT